MYKYFLAATAKAICSEKAFHWSCNCTGTLNRPTQHGRCFLASSLRRVLSRTRGRQGPATAQPVALRGRACQSAGRRRGLSADGLDGESTGSDKIKFFATPRSAFPIWCRVAWDGVDRNLSRRDSGVLLAETCTNKFSSDNFHLIISKPSCHRDATCARASQRIMQGTPPFRPYYLAWLLCSALDAEGVR